MNINVWFDDAATLAMGEAFDQACKMFRNFGSAAPAIIADRIIAAAKNGERDPARLYEQVLKAYGIDETSMLLVSVSRDPPRPGLRFDHASGVIRESSVTPSRALS